MTQQTSPSDGARLTAYAIEQVMKYMPAARYEIRLIHDDKENHPPTRRYYTGPGLLRSVRYLRGQNRAGYHVFFRPVANHFIFVDDVSKDDIDMMMADGIRPVLVYETSKGLHHAWIQLANRFDQVTEAEATEGRKILADRYGGDRCATGKNQLGRLPGFRNIKPQYEDSNGGHPLVIIKRPTFAPIAAKLLEEAKKRIASALPSPLSPGGPVQNQPSNADDVLAIYDRGKHVVTMSAQYDISDIGTAYDQALIEMTTAGYKLPIRNSGNGIDRSKQDITVASYLHRQCVKREIIEEVIHHGSEKARERGIKRGIKYVKQIVEAACSRGR